MLKNVLYEKKLRVISVIPMTIIVLVLVAAMFSKYSGTFIYFLLIFSGTVKTLLYEGEIDNLLPITEKERRIRRFIDCFIDLCSFSIIYLISRIIYLSLNSKINLSNVLLVIALNVIMIGVGLDINYDAATERKNKSKIHNIIVGSLVIVLGYRNFVMMLDNFGPSKIDFLNLINSDNDYMAPIILAFALMAFLGIVFRISKYCKMGENYEY